MISSPVNAFKNHWLPGDAMRSMRNNATRKALFTPVLESNLLCWADSLFTFQLPDTNRSRKSWRFLCFLATLVKNTYFVTIPRTSRALFRRESTPRRRIDSWSRLVCKRHIISGNVTPLCLHRIWAEIECEHFKRRKEEKPLDRFLCHKIVRPKSQKKVGHQAASNIWV